MYLNVSLLLKADRIADYVPALSTITNSVNLFQKCVLLPMKQKANVSKNHYYAYLQQKSFSRCVVLLIPVLGNIIIGIYDFAKRKHIYKDAVFAATQPVPPSAPQSSQNCNSPKPVSCEHRFTESFMVLYPHLSTQLGPVHPQAIAKNTQLVGANSQLHIQASSVIHYHGMHTSRLPEAKLHEKLKALLQLNCPGCIKDLIAQGGKFLEEANEEISLHGVFYLATAYELYHTLNIQEYKFNRRALDEYLDSLEERLENEENLLHYFAAHENRSIFIYLFAERPNIQSHLDVLAGKATKETPLHMAIRVGSIPIVQFFFDQGADFKKLDSNQNNTLHHACQSQKDCVDIVKFLLQYDPTLREAKNRDGQTPLHLAAFTGSEKSFACLLDQTTDQLQLDQQDKKGNTPLHLAILGWRESSNKGKDSYCKIVETLVKKGASLNALNQEKKTALTLAFENAAIMQALVQAKLSPQMLVSSLQSSYLSQKEISIVRIKVEQEWEFKIPLEEIYVRLAIIESKERKARDQALDKHSDYLQDGRIQTYETIFEPKQNIELEKLFEHESLAKRDYKRIYLQGAAGSGKSTLCHYIAYRWAKGDLWKGLFSYLFWIPLRNLTLEKYPADKEYTPADLIAREYAGKIDRQVIEACIDSSALREETLLILDGYDELSSKAQGNSSLAKALKGLKKLFPHILITSRPGSCSFNRSCELELLGFDKEEIKRYIDRFFKHIQAEEKKQELNRLLNTSSLVLSLAQIPINLTLLCCLFSEDPEVFDANQPITMTAIYERMVNWMYKWFLLRRIDLSQSKQTKEKILEEKNLRHNLEVAKVTAAFEDMAFFAMEKDTLYLSREVIDEFRGDGITSNELTDCGLLRIPEAEEKGYFIHLTFQEFLAASKIANQYLKGERQACRNFVRQYKFEPRYGLVLRMIAGYLSLATSRNPRYSDSGALQSFFDDLFAEPQDLAVRSELNLIAECFEECQDPTVVKQYEGFIELVKDYMAYLFSLDLNFEHLLKNKKIFNHPSVIAFIEGLLSSPNTRKEMLIKLLEVIETGQRLASGVLKSIIETLKNPYNVGTAEDALAVLKAVAEQGDELPKEAVDILIHLLQEGNLDAEFAAAGILIALVQQKGKLHEEVLAALIQIFKEGHSDAKRSAAYVLRTLAEQGSKLPEEVLAALIQIFKEGDPGAKSSVADVLRAVAEQGSRLPEKALDALIQILEEGDSDAKCSAADVLRAVAEQGSRLPEKALDALIQILEEGDSDAKCSAADVLRAVAEQGSRLPEKALDALIQILEEGDFDAKRFTADILRTLIKQGSKLPEEALGALIQILQEGDSAAKLSATLVLAISQHSEGILDALIQILKEGDYGEQVFVAGVLRALVQQGNKLPEEVLDALVQILQEGDPCGRGFAANVLRTLAEQASQLPEKVLGALIQILKEGDSDGLNFFANIQDFAADILRTLSKLPEEALGALVQILKEGNSSAKRSAAEVLRALAQQGSKLPEEALDAFVQILQEGDSAAKYFAVDVLRAQVEQVSQLPEEALGALVQILKEGNSSAKRSAAVVLRTLVQQGNKLLEEVLDALVQILQEGDPYGRAFAADVLRTLIEQGSRLPEEVLAALIQILREGDSEGRIVAAGVLRTLIQQGNKLPEEVLGALIQIFKEDDSAAKGSAAYVLGTLAEQGSKLPEEALGALVQILKEGNSSAKRSAAVVLRTLVKQGNKLPEEALEALIQILKEGDFGAKYSAAGVLRTLTKQGSKLSEEALSALVQILKEGDDDAKSSVADVLRTLAEQASQLPEQVLAALVQILKEGDSDDRGFVHDILRNVNKNALLKMGIEALPLVAKVCFFTENSFPVKDQKFQICDKKTIYSSRDKLKLSYEEIKEKLPSEIRAWRERLDSLSPTESSQSPSDEISC
ncbi:ankyrin repeat domain-containing protein [Parachlamydia sp. AcF125]|uniref:ankyrin repeat domain-containing protein n=1 Tax=Parachlamydia sp. AcF125 TaxID=2795736 RepID=UPI001BCA37AB|nr:ankyrin repeat domain-containing protein [Parachlamydia sp. AcF125]MBS4167636.1 hypothetical protein [Parachlamydia sp. AcF125]